LPAFKQKLAALLLNIQTLQLSLEDSQALVDVLLDPPLPNDALKAAALRHEQLISAQ
jgi:uncharacterized protein (DUF1778 family)